MTDRPPSPSTRRLSDAGSTAASVHVTDEQGTTAGRVVDAPRLASLVRAVLDATLPGAPVEVSVLLVDEDEMAALNAEHMGQEGPTDVLAFPIDAEPDVGTPIDAPRLLGDVVICPAVAHRQAPEHTGSFDDEMALLAVHGVLHLLGMDHAADGERQAMQARERELLLTHHGPPTRDPWT